MSDQPSDPPKHVEDEFHRELEDHVARVRAELTKRHREREAEKPLEEEYFYHGTSLKNADHVEKHGIDPGKSRYGSKTFLTRIHGEAQKYSKAAQGTGLGRVFRVHRKHLDPDHIASEHSGIIQYTGRIHPDHLEGA